MAAKRRTRTNGGPNHHAGEVGRTGSRAYDQVVSILGALAGSVLGFDPLLPRFVKSVLDPGDRILLDLLSEESIDEASARNLMRRAKALGDAIDAEREEGEGRVREGGSRRWMGSRGGGRILRRMGG